MPSSRSLNRALALLLLGACAAILVYYGGDVAPFFYPNSQYPDNWVACSAGSGPANWTGAPPGKAALFTHIATRFLHLLNRTGIPAMIVHGTLLGWRRHCDFIPHTPDIDFAAPITAFRPEWLTLMEALSDPFIDLRFGLGMNRTKVDLFFIYPLPAPETGYYMPGAAGKGWSEMLQWQFPQKTPLQVCQSSLRGLPVSIPCNVDEYVKTEYGDQWRKPVKLWAWNHSPRNVKVVRRVNVSLLHRYPRPETVDPARDERLIQEYVDKYL